MNENFDRFVRILKARVRKDWDCVVAVTGEEGSGKSTLAVKLAIDCDKNFTFDNMLFQPKHEVIHNKLVKLPNFSAIIADEAIRILYKHDWQKAGQKYMNKVFALARKENQIVFLCIPRFFDLNEYFRNWRVKFWVHVYKRGKAVVLARDENQFVKDPFHMKHNLKTLQMKMGGHGMDEAMVVNVYRRQFPNYTTHFDFDDLNADMKKEYNALKNKYAYEDLTLETDSNTKLKLINYECFMNKSLGIPTTALCVINKEPRNTIANRIAKQWPLISTDVEDKWHTTLSNIAQKWRLNSVITQRTASFTSPAISSVVDSDETSVTKKGTRPRSHHFNKKGD